MGNTSDDRLKEVLSYVSDRGMDEALNTFDLSPSTIRRYRREAEQRGLEIQEEYDGPKVLLYDLETAPLEVYTFGVRDQYIKTDHIKKPRSLLSWSAKWLCEEEVMSKRAKVEQAKEREDKDLVEPLWDLINEADILIGHNIRGFDNSVANSRFLVNDLDPPSPYQSLDTYYQIRKVFDFESNSLDHLTKKLCEDEEDKGDHSMELWMRCVEGDESALEEMEEYNRKDVRINEDLFFRTRAYYTSTPNFALYHEDMGNRCTVCESKNLVLSDNSYYTATGRYKCLRCEDCGAISRERHTDIPTEKRKRLLRTRAR